MPQKAVIPLEILILNDLLARKVIDKEIYDKAVIKITGIVDATTPTILATA